MKLAFVFAAALLLSATAASAQTSSQGTPTVNGTTSPQSAPPAQAPGSLGTLPAQNTQPAADRETTTAASAQGQTSGSNKEMKKARKKQKQKAASTTSGSSY
ncbi:hypothetical protein [Hymenobacter latericus]|uniref:hypothetical protein n=1 Tax=Hymenobacter sp. YIM 151858-1 TaxID=2987688 RepID=UPI0022270579|nr:hypothetical protein [Hymenobacter sp. YIM 151858-1]UYZ57844.1 hypothetical protein OIS50_12325 [Hymenobacter sp. YIM 151858-1]